MDDQALLGARSACFARSRLCLRWQRLAVMAGCGGQAPRRRCQAPRGDGRRSPWPARSPTGTSTPAARGAGKRGGARAGQRLRQLGTVQRRRSRHARVTCCSSSTRAPTRRPSTRPGPRSPARGPDWSWRSATSNAAEQLFESHTISAAGSRHPRRGTPGGRGGHRPRPPPACSAATLDLEFCEVRAPISGRVGRKLVTVGNLVTRRRPRTPRC